MGETAEVLARQYGITREQSDEYACATQRRAEAASTAGYFRKEIAPVTLKDAKGKDVTVETDEHPRFGTTIEALRKLPLVFPKVEGHEGIITAGTSAVSPMMRPDKGHEKPSRYIASTN
jgi:acetyl-CoA C-acetyltransferase